MGGGRAQEGLRFWGKGTRGFVALREGLFGGLWGRALEESVCGFEGMALEERVCDFEGRTLEESVCGF